MLKLSDTESEKATSNQFMKLTALILFSILSVALFLMAAKLESDTDFYWAICYGGLFVLSILTHYLTKSWKTILIVALVAPIITGGIFFIVNMVFSFLVVGAGILVSEVIGFAVRVLKGWRNA